MCVLISNKKRWMISLKIFGINMINLILSPHRELRDQRTAIICQRFDDHIAI